MTYNFPPIGDYVGQTKTKVKEKLEEARGGLLFIDEAYELGDDLYGKEALTTLLAALTDPTYKGMTVVVAGYPDDLNRMFAQNPGLKSRFQHCLDFPDWSPEDCEARICVMAEKEGFEPLSPSCCSVLRKGFDALVSRLAGRMEEMLLICGKK